MRNKMNIIIIVFTFLMLAPSVFAASISITQSGVDAGTVMLSKPFTVTVSGATANAQATINLPTGFALSGESSTKTTNNNGVVSWTTVTANQQLSAQTISVSISGQGSPETVTSSSFSVITPPSLTATVSPTSTSVTQGSTFAISLNILNSGETTARFGTITVSPSFFSISSGCSPSSISGGQSAGISCSIAASSSASTGAQTLTVTIAPSNADTLTKTVSVSVSAASSTTATTTPTSTGTGTTPGATLTKKFDSIIPEAPKTISSSELAATNTDLTEIIIAVKERVASVEINVAKLTSRPASISTDPTNAVYNFIDISAKNIIESNVASGTRIKFRVPVSWLASNSVNSNTVALYRYSSNQWNKLTTTKLDEGATYANYESIVPGFSTFAVAGESNKTTTTTTTTTPSGVTTTTVPTTTTTIPGEIPPSTAGQMILIIIIIVGVIVFVLVKMKKIKLPRKGTDTWDDLYKRYGKK